MRKYEVPEMKVAMFEKEDIVKTSGNDNGAVGAAYKATAPGTNSIAWKFGE